MISDAVGQGAVSRILGYNLTTGNFANTTPNLPQRIAIIGEANAANQSTLNLNPKVITSAQQAGELYGFGSPIYAAMRILRPVSGGGVGSVETVVYPQAEGGSAVAKVISITVTGTATGNATHNVVIGGRYSLDGESYSYAVVEGDTPTIIAGKIKDAINAVIGSPFIATSAAGVVTLTAKWKGLTSDSLTLSVDDFAITGGVTYAVASVTSGAVTPSITAALALFGNEWNTIVLNTYGAVSSVLDALEDFNGKPSPTAPTGRYTGIVFKPFVALFGSTVSVFDTLTGLTSARLNEVTNVLCPAPNSTAHAMEAAANAAVLLSVQANNTPELDVAGRAYPDMPIGTSLGAFATYSNRDLFVKSGVSTVDVVNGQYVIQDFVTTYHPAGELVPQFRYVRSLVQDFNVKFGYRLKEELYVQDHVIANDDDFVTAQKVVKPKTWKGVVNSYFLELVERGIIVDSEFSKNSLVVGISTTNPDRLETFFRYKRSGFARIAATTAEAGFNFGTL